MQRSLTAGVSGMLNNQLVMDVTANNLANVNTDGFKASRVNFSDALVQTEFAGSAPGSAIGGQNPKQVGLGMQTSSISLDMSQGSLQSTGRNLDLAIQGEGFFQVTDGVKSSYTRVGNFGFDSNDNLVDLGTGFKVVGNTYNLTTNPDGSQSLLGIAQPLNIPRNEAFPPKKTDTITMQGNLDSTTPALRGATVQTVFPYIDSTTGEAATDDTLLKNLTIFNQMPATVPLPVYVFGTKPDGTTYAGTINIDPTATPTPANNKAGTLGNLVSQINNVLAQGSVRFGSVHLDNGNLVATSAGVGDGFSMFIGEKNPISAVSPLSGGAMVGSVAYAGTPVSGSTLAGGTTTIAATDAGLIDPTFTIPPNDYSAQVGATLRVSVKVNGQESGVITIPAADYSAGGNVFTLPSLPHVNAGDVVTYDFSGNLDLQGGSISWTTNTHPDDNATNLTNDRNGDGLPDMFEENSLTDVDAYVYDKNANASFDWYRTRMVPDSVSSSIQVYDAQGGQHTVDLRYLRVGTRTDPATGARINSWDMIAGITPGDGVIKDDIVAGIEFDQQGRYTGAVGTTPEGTSLSSTTSVGNPGDANIQIDWKTTGPTDPATMRIDLGATNTFKGLTSFGSASTAAAVKQDGYADGKLDTLSVSAEGDLVGLYTNGVSRKLAQITLSVFRNPEGLTADGNNHFSESVNSGSATTRVAGVGAGLITAGALEGGNVDIATEFTRIITAQRGFEVSSRVIQTTDQMLQDLTNLIHG